MALYEITPPVQAMHRLGNTLYGERYQLAMSKALTEVTGKHVTAVQVGRWTLGNREAPGWLAFALIDVANRGIKELQDRQVAVHGELNEIRRLIPYRDPSEPPLRPSDVLKI